MPMEWGDRENFLPKALEYVGSFELTSFAAKSVDPEKAALTLADGKPHGALPPQPDDASVAAFYHVLRAATVSVGGRERDCPTGKIAYAFERMALRRADGLVEVTGQLVLHTDDNAAVDVSYSGIARFPNPVTSFLDLKRQGESGQDRLGQIFLNVGFDTSDQRYAWLSERQCIAFGKLSLSSDSAFDLIADSTYDIYSGS